MTFRSRRVEKPWGHELIWAETELYAGKVLHVKAGEALSLQMHRLKDETLHLLRGELTLRAGPSLEELAEIPFHEGDSFRVRPGTVHMIEARTDADVLEVSTPFLDDVVRFRDRYGRVSDESPDGE